MLKLSPSALSKLGIVVNQDGIKRSAHELLGHRDIGKERVLEIWPEVGQIPQQYLELCRNNSMYESYVRRQEADIEAYRKDENLVFPEGIDFCSVGGLSNEARQALETVKPQTLGQAARIPGITPAATNFASTRAGAGSSTQVSPGGRLIKNGWSRGLLEHVSVSRETIEKLETYATLLLRWQSKINLISTNSLQQAWHRHFLDSAQIYLMSPKKAASAYRCGARGQVSRDWCSL